MSVKSKQLKFLGWLTAFLTVLALTFELVKYVPPSDSIIDIIITLFVYLFFISVILEGVAFLFLKQFTLGIFVLVVFPTSVFLSPHFFDISDILISILGSIRVVIQYLIPIGCSFYLIKKTGV